MTLELPALVELGVLSELDLHFARTLVRLFDAHDPRVALAAALCSRKVQQGHVCLDLPRLCRQERTLVIDGQPVALDWPELDGWLELLAHSALVGGAASDGRPDAPLQLDARGRLYLKRYFEHEQSLARAILERAKLREPGGGRKGLTAALDRLFGAGPRARDTRQLDLFGAAEPDRQREAAERAATRAFCVISGGPGTGKTATVVKILALLVEQARARGAAAPRVLLLAPTGKAAARLSESIRKAKGGLRAEPEVIAQIGEAASTIHRALGAYGVTGPRFRHDRDAPLAADVVVVDEASMVDLALMARLMDAVPANARVILLGDKDQLASVEAGAVLGDICGAGLEALAEDAPIAASIALLTRSYRYAEDSGIRKLAEAIHGAQAERSLGLLTDPGIADVTLVPSADGAPPRALFEAAAAAFAPLARAGDPAGALAALEQVRVLCAHRRGPFGQLRINTGIEGALRELGLGTGLGERYSGRPLIVTQNDYQARLFNGEVGVLLRDGEGRLLAHFMAEGGAPRAIPLARLPRCETAYALSVHKSQGSEFDDVLLLLPPEPSPLLSRELLYTAVTRARRRVTVFGRPEVWADAVQRSVPRASGLRDALWGQHSD